MKQKFKKFFPIIGQLDWYSKNMFLSDFIAWLVLAIILLPKAMAYAMIAWLPPEYWLYACLLSPAIWAIWWSSKQLSTWPAAVISFLVFASVSGIAALWSQDFISFAILLAVLVWIIQITMSIFRLWFIMNFISHSVIVGFTNAAAIIIAVSQIKDILWLKFDQSDIFFENIKLIIQNITHTNPVIFWIWLLSIFIILFSKKIHKLFPWWIVAIILFTFLTQFLDWETIYHVKVIWEISNKLPIPSLPVFDLWTIWKLLPMAFVMAIIGFMEAYSIAKSIWAKTKQKIDINQELMWQGLANLFTGFIRWYPVSWSFSWTAVNYDAWAKTWISNVVASLFIIFTIVFLAQYLHFLPKAVLWAIVILAAIWLFKPKEMFHLYKVNKIDWIVAFITFFMSLLMKPDYAIFIWAFLALVLFLYKTARPKLVELSRSWDLGKFVNADLYKLDKCPKIMIIRPEMSLYFANSEYIFETMLKKVEMNKQLKYFMIESSSINNIDATAIEYLYTFYEDLNKLWIELYFLNMKTQLKSDLKKAWVMSVILEERFIMWKSWVIARFTKDIWTDYCKKCPYSIFKECSQYKS